MSSNYSQLLPVAVQLIAHGRGYSAVAFVQAAGMLDRWNLFALNRIALNRLRSNFSEAFEAKACISPVDKIYALFTGHPASIHPVRERVAIGSTKLAEVFVHFGRPNRKLTCSGRILKIASCFGRFKLHPVKILSAGNRQFPMSCPAAWTFWPSSSRSTFSARESTLVRRTGRTTPASFLFAGSSDISRGQRGRGDSANYLRTMGRGHRPSTLMARSVRIPGVTLHEEGLSRATPPARPAHFQAKSTDRSLLRWRSCATRSYRIWNVLALPTLEFASGTIQMPLCCFANKA